MTPTRTVLLNIISGLSLAICIIFGVTYVSFKNAMVFQDVKIEITNNPITKNGDIEFEMIGYKRYECASTRVYGIAHHVDDGHTYELNKFTKQYTRNTRPGAFVPNQFSMSVPSGMLHNGEYLVSMTGEFVCNHWIFQVPKVQSYNNILLIIQPLDNNQ